MLLRLSLCWLHRIEGVSYNVLMTIALQHATSQQLLDAIGNLPTDELLSIADGVSQLRARRMAPSLSTPETKLQQRIQHAVLSTPERRRLAELGAKLETEPLTLSEQSEMLTLTDRSELLNVERLKAVQELAILRNQPFREVMQELGLLNPQGQ